MRLSGASAYPPPPRGGFKYNKRKFGDSVVAGLEPVAELPCAFVDRTAPVLPMWDAVVPLRAGEDVEIALELPEKLTSGVARGEVLGYAMIGIKKMVKALIMIYYIQMVT